MSRDGQRICEKTIELFKNVPQRKTESGGILGPIISDPSDSTASSTMINQ